MQHKGYDVELVAVNFEVWEAGDTGQAECVKRLTKQLALKHSLLVTASGTKELPLKAKKGQFWPMVEAAEDFATYDFTVISARLWPILPDMVDDFGVGQTIGPETVFWERLVECRERWRRQFDNSQLGSFVSVWAIDEQTHYTEFGSEPEFDWELVGFIGPDMQVIEVGFSWPPKTDAYDYYVAQERTANPDFGLQIYLCGFDYQTAFDEVAQ